MRFVVFADAEGQKVHGALQILLLEDVGDADLAQALAFGGVERLAGGEHDGVAVVFKFLQQPQLEFLRVVDRQGGHQVERAARAFADDAGDLVQLAHDRIAAALVLLPDLLEIIRANGIERGGRDLIERGDGQARLTVFEGVGHEVLVAADETADPRAAGGEALGDGVDEDQVFLTVVKLAERMQRLAVVGELAVDLVGHEIQIMLHRNIEQHLHLLDGQAGAGGVAGVRDHDRLGLRRDAGLDARAVGVEIAFLRPGMQRMDHAAGRGDEGMVVGIERLGDDDLVAVVEQTVGRDLQRFAAAGRHKDVGLAQLHADVPVIALDRGDQLRNAGGGRVGQHGRAEIVDRVIEGIRRVDIGLADIQMIDLLAGCRCCHCVRMEFTHGGLAACKCFAGQLHMNTSCTRISRDVHPVLCIKFRTKISFIIPQGSPKNQ